VQKRVPRNPDKLAYAKRRSLARLDIAICSIVRSQQARALDDVCTCIVIDPDRGTMGDVANLV